MSKDTGQHYDLTCPIAKGGTVDVVYTWKYGGPHIVTTICANEMKLCLYNAYVI